MSFRDRLANVSLEGVGHVIGLAAVIVATAGIALSIGFAESFMLREHALSDLGAPGAETGWLFNGTVILAGVLATLFCLSLYPNLANRFRRLGTGLMAIAGLGAAGVGVFPLGHALHEPVAAVFFIGLTAGLVAFGYGDLERERPRRGQVLLNLALLHLVAWSFAIVTLDGLALPELVGIAAYGIWIILVVIHRGRLLP